MMLTYHISHEKIFSTALYVPGRSGDKEHLIKIYTNTHQIAPLFKIFSEDLLNLVMYAHLSLFEKKIVIQKGPLFPIFN